MYKMEKQLVFNNGHNDYYNNKYYFQKYKNKPININEVNTEKMLFNKTPNGEYGANKYYIAYLMGCFKTLHIIIKDIKLYTNHMNVLANDNELLKYIEMWNKIESLINKKFNQKGFYSKPTYNNEYIRTKISSYNDNVWGNKRLIKDEYYGHSILLLESISEVESKYYPQTFLDNFFEKHDKNTINSLFNELVQIFDWSDDESNDKF